MLGLAQKHGYAVGHFNTTNLEETQAIISAATHLRAPIIIGTSTKAITYTGTGNLCLLIKNMAHAKIPIALHLDHGPNLAWAQRCIKEGYTSVMIDTSSLDYAQNVATTQKVVAYAHKRKISVEAEIGILKGVEDDISSKQEYLTTPKEATRFVADTRCDSLAIAIGTSHGAYKFSQKPKLDLQRLWEIREEVSVPLVLHGASSVYPELVTKINRYGGRINNAQGVPDTILRKAIKAGICKINTDTDLRLAFTLGIRRHLSQHPQVYDIRETLEEARQELQQMVERKIKLFESDGKA